MFLPQNLSFPTFLDFSDIMVKIIHTNCLFFFKQCFDNNYYFKHPRTYHKLYNIHTAGNSKRIIFLSDSQIILKQPTN